MLCNYYQVVVTLPTFENLGTSGTLVFIGCHLSKGQIAVDGDYGTSLNHGGYVLFVALRLFRLYERMVVGKVASMLHYVFVPLKLYKLLSSMYLV